MIIDDLRTIIDTRAHLQHGADTIYIEENAPDAKLRRVSVQARSTDYVAFKLDMERNIVCKWRATKCSSERTRCNELSSKICTIFSNEPGLHKGCDAVICEVVNGELCFFVIELKSRGARLAEVGLQFAATVSFINYICSILKHTFGHIDIQPKIYCSLMWLKEPTPKHKTRQSHFDFETINSVRFNVRPLSTPNQYAANAFPLALLQNYGRDFVPSLPA